MLGFKLKNETILVCRGEETEVIMKELAEADCAGLIRKLSWITSIREFASEKVYIIRWNHQMKIYNKAEPWFRFKV